MLKKLFKNQKGMGIAITIMSLVLIAILGTALVIRGMTLANVITKKNYSITAVEAAKAGVSYAVYMVEQDPDCNTPLPPTPLTTYTVTDQKIRGYYEVQIKNNINGTTSVPSISGAIPNIPPGKIEIVATGYCGYVSSANYKSKARVIAIGTALIKDSNPFQYSIFADEGIDTSGNAGQGFLSDSYDSSVNPNVYSGGSHGDIGVNSGLSSDPNTLALGGRNINGQIKVPSGVDVSGSGTYRDPNGIQVTLPAQNYTPLAEPFDLPPVPNKVAGTVDVNAGSTLSGGGAYRNLSISGNNTTTLNEGVYIFENLTLTGGGNAETSLKVNGNVTIYVTGSINLSGQANINTITTGNGNGRNAVTTPLASASHLMIYGTSTCTEVNLGGAGSLCGAIYAPNANITLHGMGNSNSDLWGSFVGKTVTLNGAKVSTHYDEALGKLPGTKIIDGIDNNNITWSWSYGY